ncbi:MAG: D-2-hydroxyacid dehydrogenase [Burkholderiales bacterium]|nr:D-2-hydroxyacid dehydrogenase [Burkholderiales bacterium]
MLNIVFLDRASLPVDVRAPNIAHHWTAYDATSKVDVIARLADADIAISNKVRLDAETIAALPRLKLIAVAATGTNNVDVDAARARNIPVCNIRGYADNTVPEHALMLMLALARSLPAYRQDLADGAWQRSPYFCHFGAPIRDLSGRTLAIIGNGSLGKRTAALASAFGMRVLCADHKGASARPGYTAFGDALREADIVSLHCPLTPETRGLIGGAELASMKPDAILINTARGGLVDEAALLDALRNGRLGGAGLDVVQEEPPVNGNALLDVQLPNLIITPHVGWASRDAMERLAEQLMGNIEAWAKGAPRNLV